MTELALSSDLHMVECRKKVLRNAEMFSHTPAKDDRKGTTETKRPRDEPQSRTVKREIKGKHHLSDSDAFL